RPNEKEVNIQIWRLVLQSDISSDRIGPGPAIEHWQSERDRNEQDRQQRKRATRGLQGATDGDTPATTCQMVQQRNSQASDRDTPPEQEGNQIRRIEKCRLQKCSCSHRYRPYHTHDERGGADVRQDRLNI